MNTKKFQSSLIVVPVEINDIFISEFSFKVHPSKGEFVKMNFKNIQFSSSVVVLDENKKQLQVNVRIQSNEEDNLCDFLISCVGLYTWKKDTLDEVDVKNIYSWGVAVQTSMIRQKLAQETANSPYHDAWYFPLALVKVNEDN